MTTSNSKHARLPSGFQDWISVQRADLDELQHTLNVIPEPDAKVLCRLARKTIQHLDDYQQARSVCNNTSSYFGTSLFWIGGFKPTIYIRLACSIAEIGSEKLEFELPKFFIGERIGISDMQVKLIKGLHAETVKSEDQISSRMANLQECMAIEPLMIGGSEVCVDRALAAHRVAYDGVVVDADELRMKVLKELIDEILTPIQGVHLLVASTRLHLCIH